MKKNNPIFLESILKFDVPIGICSNYVNLKKYTKNKNFDDINIRQWDIEIRQNHLIQEIVFTNQNNSKILLKYNQRAGHILYHNLSAKNMPHDYIKSIFEPFLKNITWDREGHNFPITVNHPIDVQPYLDQFQDLFPVKVREEFFHTCNNPSTTKNSILSKCLGLSYKLSILTEKTDILKKGRREESELIIYYENYREVMAIPFISIVTSNLTKDDINNKKEGKHNFSFPVIAFVSYWSINKTDAKIDLKNFANPIREIIFNCFNEDNNEDNEFFDIWKKCNEISSSITDEFYCNVLLAQNKNSDGFCALILIPLIKIEKDLIEMFHKQIGIDSIERYLTENNYDYYWKKNGYVGKKF